jgi:hypothetical protein
MSDTLHVVVSDKEFKDGKGFTEYDVQHQIDSFILKSIRERLVGREFNFVITVETKRHRDLRGRIYEVTVID